MSPLLVGGTAVVACSRREKLGLPPRQIFISVPALCEQGADVLSHRDGARVPSIGVLRTLKNIGSRFVVRNAKVTDGEYGLEHKNQQQRVSLLLSVLLGNVS